MNDWRQLISAGPRTIHRDQKQGVGTWSGSAHFKETMLTCRKYRQFIPLNYTNDH